MLVILCKEFQVVYIKEMVYCVIIYFIAVSCIIKKFAKGYQSNTKQNRRKRIPLKYSTVNIDIAAFNVFSLVFKTNVVFHIRML